MPLPLSIDPSSPIDTDTPSQGDNEFRALKDFIASVFGIPLATNVTAAAFAITAGGVVTASQSPFTTKDIVATVGTITTDKPVLKGTETWNAAGVTFNAIDIDVTDTASAAASLLLNIKKATTAQLTLDKNAVLTALGNVQSDANLAFKSGTAFLGTLDHAISAARVWTLPDVTGTVLTTGNPTDLTAAGTITSGTWNGTAIGVAYGGTGLASGTSGGVLGYTATGTLASSALLTLRGLLVGGGAGATPTALAAMTNGQLPIGSTGANPVPTTLTAGNNIEITNAAGSITIAAVAGGASRTKGYFECEFGGDAIPSEWTTAVTNSGAVAIRSGAGILGGQVRLSTGATSGSTARLTLGALGTDVIVDGNGNEPITFEARIRASATATTFGFEFGLGDTAGVGSNTNGIYALKSTGGGTVNLNTENASNITTIASTTFNANIWYTVRFERTTSQIEVFVGGASVGTTGTNLSTGEMTIFFEVSNTTTTDYTLDVDYVSLSWTRNASD